MRKGSDNAAFFSALNSRRPNSFGNSEEVKSCRAELTRLGTQLPLPVFVTAGHYLKVLQREKIGLLERAHRLELELNKWIRQYVA